MFEIRGKRAEIKQYHNTPSKVYTIVNFGGSIEAQAVN
jgi:hypothetical protein